NATRYAVLLSPSLPLRPSVSATGFQSESVVLTGFCGAGATTPPGPGGFVWPALPPPALQPAASATSTAAAAAVMRLLPRVMRILVEPMMFPHFPVPAPRLARLAIWFRLLSERPPKRHHVGRGGSGGDRRDRRRRPLWCSRGIAAQDQAAPVELV